jgi:hypothetical protein
MLFCMYDNCRQSMKKYIGRPNDNLQSHIDQQSEDWKDIVLL